MAKTDGTFMTTPDRQAALEQKAQEPRFTYMHLTCGKEGLATKKGMATLAILLDKTPVVRVGVSFCAPKDHFWKVKARQIARERALTKRVRENGTVDTSRYSFTLSTRHNLKMHELKSAVFEAFINLLKEGRFVEDPRPVEHRNQHAYNVPTWAERFGKTEVAKTEEAQG